jgi:hypothetical protein
MEVHDPNRGSGSESINDLGEQLILQLSSTRYFVVFQAWAFFPPPAC